MTTPTTYIDQIQQAFKALREGFAGLETSLLDWTGDMVEHHHTTVAETPAEDTAPATPSPTKAAAEPVEPVETTEADSFPYSFEDVRQILGPIAKDGGKHAIQNALQHVGAKRLSDVDPKHYQSLIESVQQAVA